MAGDQLSGEILRSLLYQFLPRGETDLSGGPSLGAVVSDINLHCTAHKLLDISVQARSADCTVEIDVVSSMVASLH